MNKKTAIPIFILVVSIAFLVITKKRESKSAEWAKTELQRLKDLRDKVKSRRPRTETDSLWLIDANALIEQNEWRLNPGAARK